MKLSQVAAAMVLVLAGLVTSSGTAHAATVRTNWFTGDCTTDMQWAGNVGKINAQFNEASRYMQWNVTMYNPAANVGRWIADLYVGKRKVDHKDQNYNPHGSLSPNDMRAGQRLTFVIQHFDPEGRASFSAPDAGCNIP